MAEDKNFQELYEREEKINELSLTLNQAENIDEILLTLKDQILDIFEGERITVYAVEPTTKEIYSKVKTGEGLAEIRVPVNKSSIAGFAAVTGKTVNVIDVYDESELNERYPGIQFDSSWDQKSGFRTKSVLAMPLLIKDKYLQGVVQLINKQNGQSFNEEDERLLEKVAKGLAVAFYNQNRIARKPTKYDLLIAEHVISQDDLDKAIKRAREERSPIRSDVSYVLINDFGVDKASLGESLARHYDTEFVEYSDTVMIPTSLLQGLNIKFLMKNFWVPFNREGDEIVIITDDPSDPEKLRGIRAAGLAEKVRFVVGLREDIVQFIEFSVGGRPTESTSSIDEFIDELDDGAMEFAHDMDSADDDMLNEDAPTVVKLVTRVIKDGYDMGVSDIHIEPYFGKQPTEVRFRRDGECFKYLDVPATHSRAVVNRIKIMSKLDISERRLPQSGKIKMKYGNRDVELRVEVTPTAGNNEDVVMRILAAGKPMPLEKMNFSPRNLDGLLESIDKPYGILLVVGPTGSGKTTTLHSIMGYLNVPDRKIWTAEDPVEITQYRLRQVQTYAKIGYTFAAAMRSFLRADPDIIMVGEMRDEETAHIGIEASLTGHLVLSTLHTNSAPETITRLIDMGMNPLNFADALLGILAQRLVRTLCPDCKEPYHPTQEEYQQVAEDYGLENWPEVGVEYNDDFKLWKHKGCVKCNDTGYRGRTGLHEFLNGTKTLKELIVERAHVEEIRVQAMNEGMRTLKQDGIYKVLKGDTDMVNVRKVCIE